ncbi:DUF427 domain-containing protein [Bosea sp. PAMC 26642]|uniref:DUF427 domain-containing protein n=1 Tax=Bosea sp. (strain PAMC 26642) TaxID=1792307 RepID=UPI0007701603|nr:DUF427 domain-containing protein [Bosea sp. PAMC 26642]AMJ63240.1 hypothetical protein AXW83_25675 [Bosea sp. PAMC 26642]
MNVTRDPTGPGQESVWSFPRPAVAEACSHHILIRHRGQTIAEARDSVRVIETSHPPTYYLPPDSIANARLIPSPHRSICEWKGQASYVDLELGGETLQQVGWLYRSPTPAFRILANFIAFYAGPFDECLVDGHRVTPQPGGFYGGWITPLVAGPFKGIPGSRFW